METNKTLFVTEITYYDCHVFPCAQNPGALHKYIVAKYVKELGVVDYIAKVTVVFGILGVKMMCNTFFLDLLILFVENAPIRGTRHNEVE
jgi:hypothetical protein